MSLAIDTNKIVAVLLADGWHRVLRKSFDLDSYEFIQGPEPYKASLDHEKLGKAAWEQRSNQKAHENPVLGGGEEDLVPAVGFTFDTRAEDDSVVEMSGPLTSILAVRTK